MNIAFEKRCMASMIFSFMRTDSFFLLCFPQGASARVLCNGRVYTTQYAKKVSICKLFLGKRKPVTQSGNRFC